MQNCKIAKLQNWKIGKLRNYKIAKDLDSVRKKVSVEEIQHCPRKTASCESGEREMLFRFAKDAHPVQRKIEMPSSIDKNKKLLRC